MGKKLGGNIHSLGLYIVEFLPRLARHGAGLLGLPAHALDAALGAGLEFGQLAVFVVESSGSVGVVIVSE